MSAADPTLPSAKEVEKFHTNADTDGSPKAVHHTIGINPNQAASGHHDHRGGNSVLLFEGLNITGSRDGNAAIQSIIDILVEFGATDLTTL